MVVLVSVLSLSAVSAVQLPEVPCLYSTTYAVIEEPPSFEGAVHKSETCALPDVAWSAVGAAGTVRGVEVTVVDNVLPAPAVLTADILNT